MEQSEKKMYPNSERGAKAVSKKAMSRFEKESERMHKRHPGFSSTFNLGFILMLAAVVIAALALRQFIFDPTIVDGTSMEQYLHDHERVAVNKTAYWLHEPERGDIVIVHYPDRTERFVKRIIAFGGETISIMDGYVYINGQKLDESAYAGDWYGNITRLVTTVGSVNGVYKVPEGYVFVMGDNRNLSHDSRARDVGPIANEQVLGKCVAVVWPLGAIRCAG